jgi:uncharacterized protein YggT (Ycf19 family)
MATVREVRSERVDWRPSVGSAYEAREVSRGAQLVNYLLTITETLLLFRFIFRLFGANDGNGFVRFVYDLTAPLVAPFRGIFASPNENGAVFDSAAVLAIVVYAVLAYLVVRFFFAATSNETIVYRDEPEIR